MTEHAISWQASAVAIDGRALLIEGRPGSGKSSLTLALIDRGARLIGDDAVLLSAVEGSLLAAPHPNTRGLLEIRNLGLVQMDCAEATPVSLIVTLDPEAPRFIEMAESSIRAGIAVPLVRLWPEASALPLRAEWAMRLFGDDGVPE